MPPHIFFAKYANVPLSDRLHILNFSATGLASLKIIYQEVHDLEEQMRPLRLRQQELIDSVAEYVEKHQAGQAPQKGNNDEN
jgi:hypothetical protein